jgi:multidrug resistance efflux pump
VWAAALAAVVSAVAARGDDAPAPRGDPGASGERAAVRRVDLSLRVEREGRIDARGRVKVRVGIQAYGGPLEVAEVRRERGAVEAGEEILRLAAPRLEEELRAAREAAEQARERLGWHGEELRLQTEAARLQLERLERAKRNADLALHLFEEFHGPKMLRASELDVKGREQNLENARQELAQLERMYEGTHLASDTKDIVLERARRGVEMSEAWLELARRDRVATVEHEHPRRAREVREDARWAAEELARGGESARVAEAKKRAEVEAAEIALRGARERLERLEGDRARLAVRAAAAGILAPLGLDAGDSVDGKAVVATVLDVRGLVVRFQARAEDLRVVGLGREAAIRFPEMPEGRAAGVIAELADAGAETKEGSLFAARVDLSSTPEGLRPGMRAVVVARATLTDVLVVPERAVAKDGEGAWCAVEKADGSRERRAVTVGASGEGGLVQVVDGLEEGEQVVLPAAEKPSDGEGPPATPVEAPKPARRVSRAPASVESLPSGPVPTPAEARAHGVRYLVASQNRDGSWGTFESARPGEIYLGTVASHDAFRVATSALATLALAASAEEDAAAREALRRGARFLVEAPATARATGDTFYDTWAHAYLCTAAARLAGHPALADMTGALRATLAREVRALVERQGADGGFAYYDFGYSRAVPSGHMSTSFLTAVVLLALRDARAAGSPAPDAVVADALVSLERQRLPSGAYVYGTYAELRPGALFNWVNGSLGRSQPCNLALYAHGRGVTRDELAAGLRALRDRHHFIEIGKGRPYPHEAWYYTAGYYFLFGHYYAARAIAELSPEERALLAPWLAETLARLQDPDGSWFDFPLYGYHRAYGTAFAVLALEALEGAGMASGSGEAGLR